MSRQHSSSDAALYEFQQIVQTIYDFTRDCEPIPPALTDIYKAKQMLLDALAEWESLAAAQGE